jgi:RNA-directed DNA polymerase
MTEAFNNAPTEMLEHALSSANMQRAWKQVRRNKGSAGVDGMTIEAAAPWLREHWQSVKADVLAGRYAPQPVRRVDIPKPDGSKRMLGIPTVIDRLLQQAVAIRGRLYRAKGCGD